MRTIPAVHRLRPLALGATLVLATRVVQAQERPAPFTVDGRVALHALIALTDGHLRKMADMLGQLAATDDARSAQWERIRPLLADAARANVPAVVWFALPDGGYWTASRGRADASLSDRPYFTRLLAGGTVIGDLVVSRSSNSNSAIVAVPVRTRGGAVVGVLGSSVHLDSLAALLREELGGLDAGHVFFALGSGGLGAMNSDPSLIFTEPMKLGDAGMRAAFAEMLTRQAGTVAYSFRGSRRTVIYRRSPVSGWWFGFGAVEPSH